MLTTLRQGYWFLIAPALIFIFAFCVVPLIQIFWLSISEPTVGLQNYIELLQRPLLHRIWLTTLRVCLTTTAITVIVGYVVGCAMVRVGERQRTWMMFCVLLTFWLSVLVRAFAWVMLLRADGIINQGLMALGLVNTPITLVRNEFGVVVGMVHAMLPLAILPIYSSLVGIDNKYMNAARGLGATATQAFLYVYLPLSKPGLTAATILVFVFSLGFFITPALLGGGKVVMVSEYIRVSFEETLRWGQAAMMACTLLSAVGLIFAIVARWINLKEIFGAR